jgi:hypothetical protein
VVDEEREESNFGQNAIVPNRTNALRSTSESGQSGSSDASVPWCSRRLPNGLGLKNPRSLSAHRDDAVQ